MNNYIKIVIGHHTVAKEHIENYGLTHKTTWMQAIRITVYDIIFNNTVYDKDTSSYIVYEINKVYTVGTEYALIVRMYVPKEHRGKKIISRLLDKIPYLTISTKGDFGEVGKLYIARKCI